GARLSSCLQRADLLVRNPHPVTKQFADKTEHGTQRVAARMSVTQRVATTIPMMHRAAATMFVTRLARTTIPKIRRVVVVMILVTQSAPTTILMIHRAVARMRVILHA